MREIICEIGQNFGGDLGYATSLIYAAVGAGADVIKFQVFDTDQIFDPTDIYYHYSKHSQLKFKDVKKLKNICDSVGVEFMASVFDLTRLEWLETLNVKRYKIASRSIKDETLIQAIVRTGKPIIASLGLWDKPEFPNFDAKFLYCVAEYPALDVDLTNVDFTKYAGFSDHTLGINKAIEAVKLGATIIEKHFTFYKNMYMVDNLCSMTPSELQKLRKVCDDKR